MKLGCNGLDVLVAVLCIALGTAVQAHTSPCARTSSFWELVEAGEQYLQAGSFEAAAECLSKASQTADGGMHRAEAQYLLGEALNAQGRTQLALEAFRTAALSQDAMQLLQQQGVNGAVALARGKLGLALEEQGQPLAALQAYEDGVAADATQAGLWYNAGYLLLVHGDSEGARRRFKSGLRVDPQCCICVEGLGTTYFGEGRFLYALNAFQKALACNPTKLLTRQNVAAALGKLASDLDAAYTQRAIAAYEAVLELDAANTEARAKAVFLREQVCDWRSFPAHFSLLEAATKQQLASGYRPSVVPFNALSLPFSLSDLLSISSAFSPPAAPSFSFDTLHATALHLQHLRVGFLSADLRDHPVGRDLAVIFKHLQAQEGLQVLAFAINPQPTADTDRAWVTRIARAAASLTHIHNLGDMEAAQQIVGSQVHVLVDVMGHTRSSRKGVLALQPAPVQVAFKGYMSTTGAAYLSLTTDVIATPPELAPFFSEPFLYLPSSFFVSGHAENHPEVLSPTLAKQRVDEEIELIGIKPQSLTFCCFNGLYKLDQELFEGWVELLSSLQTPTPPTLWLPNDPKEAKAHLCREAQAVNTSCSRLLFSSHSPFDIHVQVKSRCDLSLDTRKYNAHGTASDVLWAGVPLLTLPGLAMAQRVAASIVVFSGLPELVARDLEDYLSIAAQVAKDSGRLQKLRRQVREQRQGWRLTDPAGWARDFRRMVRQLYDYDAAGVALRTEGAFHHVVARA